MSVQSGSEKLPTESVSQAIYTQLSMGTMCISQCLPVPAQCPRADPAPAAPQGHWWPVCWHLSCPDSPATVTSCRQVGQTIQNVHFLPNLIKGYQFIWRMKQHDSSRVSASQWQTLTVDPFSSTSQRPCFCCSLILYIIFIH